MLLLKYRKSKELNREIKYRHDECTGHTGNLYVRYGFKKGVAGWHYFCQSCGSTPGGLAGFCSTEVRSAPLETLTQLNELLSTPVPNIVVPELILPDDITTELPPIATRYMLKYDLSDFEIGLSRFGWSRQLDRLIMPVYDNQDLIYWQGRNLGEVTPDRPKYKNVYQVGSCDIFAQFIRRDKGLGMVDEDTIVLVEAIISAVKLSRHVDCVALLGSYIPNQILRCINRYARVLIWLDPDKVQASIKASARFGMLTGGPVMSVLSGKKPKQYNDREIICHLNQQT